MTTTSRKVDRHGARIGWALMILGAWAAVAVPVTGVDGAISPAASAVSGLAGAVIAFAGVFVVSGGERRSVLAAFMAILGTLAFLIAPMGGIFSPDAAP